MPRPVFAGRSATTPTISYQVNGSDPGRISPEGEALLAELGITYPAGTTSDADVNTKFSVLGMPTTVFIHADGRILRTWTGALNEAKMNEIVDKLVAG